MENQTAEIVAMAEDLNAARNELATINESKDRFFSIIAHDLKSPFTPILGFSQMLMTTSSTMSSEKIEEYARMIYRAADSALTLLEDLLEWSRLQLGGKTFEPAHLDVNELIKDHIDRYRMNAETKGITLCRAAGDAVHAFADEDMTATVLRNLISNAIKFTEMGGVIQVGVEAVDGMTRIFVEDNGIGISEDRIEILFELGEKTSTVGSQGEKGTGLGLAICKEMIERQGGAISVESTPGEGSTFSFTLPLPHFDKTEPPAGS